MQTVLVAGGSGFIGSHLCKSLLSDNFRIICVDNFITGDKNNLINVLQDQNFKLIEADIAEELPQDLITEKIDYVFDLASPASPNKKSPRSFINHPIETLRANSFGVYNLLNLAKDKNAKILYVSSSEVYGDPLISPQTEEYFGNVNPNGIRSVYDEGKRFGEAITMAYFRKFDVDIRIIRIFNTYGPSMQKDDGRIISNLINQAINNQPLTIYGNGEQTRSFCYVSDMVEGLKKAMFLPKTKGEVFNMGNPDERQILEMANLIRKMTNSSSQILFEELPQDDPKRRKPDISKAKKLLNWEPKITIEEGLGKTIEYFKSL